jgi:hypothetical protein
MAVLVMEMADWLTRSPNVNAVFRLMFIRHKISPETVPSPWGVLPMVRKQFGSWYGSILKGAGHFPPDEFWDSKLPTNSTLFRRRFAMARQVFQPYYPKPSSVFSRQVRFGATGRRIVYG